MKLIRMIGRDIRDAFKSVFRNFSLSMASISNITVTLLLAGLAIISSYNINNFAKLIKEDLTIVVFLEKDITEDKVKDVEDSIKMLDNIANYEFKSKEDIKKSMMKESEVYNKIMQNWNVEDNPLYNTYMIKIKEIEKVKETADNLKKIDNVELVKYGEDFISRYILVFKTVEKILIGIVILFVVVTVFLINNTIKITISSRRNEIEIMRLVGASNFNIQLPFIVEGLIIGMIGAILPIISAIYGYTNLYDHFSNNPISPFFKLVSPDPFIYLVSLILLGIGILVGMLGSFTAVRKYLKI